MCPLLGSGHSSARSAVRFTAAEQPLAHVDFRSLVVLSTGCHCSNCSYCSSVPVHRLASINYLPRLRGTKSACGGAKSALRGTEFSRCGGQNQPTHPQAVFGGRNQPCGGRKSAVAGGEISRSPPPEKGRQISVALLPRNDGRFRSMSDSIHNLPLLPLRRGNRRSRPATFGSRRRRIPRLCRCRCRS